MPFDRRNLFLCCFLFLLVPSVAFSSGISLGFRFYGGLQSMAGGDLNTGMAGLSKYYELQADLAGMSLEGEYQNLGWGFHAGGDLLISFAPWIGLELGGGYSQASKETVIAYEGPPDEGRWTVKPAASAIPIRAGLFFLVPLGPGLSLSAHGGAAYYLATVETLFRVESDAVGQWRQETQKATAEGIGFYGGLGLEIRISPGIFFLVEAQGRLASFDGFEGDLDFSTSDGSTDTRSGTLYHFEVALPPGLSESSLSWLYVYDEAPSGYGLSEVRLGKSGFRRARFCRRHRHPVLRTGGWKDHNVRIQGGHHEKNRHKDLDGNACFWE